jgi:hypothetical protein
MVEDSVDLPVVLTILPENVLQEHQLHMQALLIALSSSSVHQCGKYSLLTGWVVVFSPGGSVCSHQLMLVPRLQIFYSEDRGNTFLQNVGSRKLYTVPHPRRRHSS